MLDLVCPKEKPCDSVPENQPAANDAVAPAKSTAQ
jgi:alpha,alpha-trehalase